MELVESQLFTHAVTNNFNINPIVTLFFNNLRTIQAIHDSGIVHRDIKGYNFFVCGE